MSIKYILMLSMDQTLALYDTSRNIVHKYKPSESNEAGCYNGIEWLIEDFLFSVYNINGQVSVFDIGFNRIDLTYMSRYRTRFGSLSEYLNANIFAKFELTANASRPFNQQLTSECNRFVRLVSSQHIHTESLWTCFHFSKGPFGLFRISLPDNFNKVSLISYYIQNSQNTQLEGDCLQLSKHLTEAVNLLNQLDWDTEPSTCIAGLYKILNFILSGRVVFNLKTELLVEEALGSFYRPKRALNEKTIYENKYQVSRYARKFFYQLLRHSSLNKAYLLAVDIGAKDLFNDLYYCALDKSEKQLAELCRRKYHEIVVEERQIKLRSELNRSVTTIDDNIVSASTDFDRYSVSSSENNSIASDNESYCSSNDFDDLSSQMEHIKLSTSHRAIPIRVYSEAEVQEYAKSIFEQNKFIQQLNFDNLV